MDSLSGSKKPVKTVKLPTLGGKKVGASTAGPGISEQNLVDFAGVVPKPQLLSQTSQSPYNVSPVTLTPIRRVRAPRLAQTLEERLNEKFQSKSGPSQDSRSLLIESGTFKEQTIRMPPGAESNTDRAPMMGVTLSEAINVGTQPLRPNKLAEAYTETLGQRAVRSKNRREYIREVGSEHRFKARRRQEKREKERKERRLNLEDNDKLIEFVQSVVPAKLLKYSKFFSKKKKKEGVQKRLSMGQIMLAMMHEAEGDSESDDEDNQEDEAPNGRPSLLRRASHTGPVGDDDAGGSSERKGSKQTTSRPRITICAPGKETDDGDPSSPHLTLKHKHPKGARMAKLGSLLSQAQSSKKVLRLLRARTAQFEALAPEERQRLKAAFEKHDKDEGGTLDTKELKAALVQLGLKAQREQEKKEIALIVQECVILGDVDFFNFCFDLVPRVRKRLKEMREGPMLEMFKKYDQDGSGFLDRDECKDIFKSVCGTNLDIQSGKELMEIFSELHAKVADKDGSDLVNFDGFQVLIAHLQEMAGRLRSDREKWILENHDIPKFLIGRHSDELITLHEAFQRADVDESGELTESEVKTVLREYNLLPRDTWEQDRILSIINSCDENGDGELQFPEFLLLVTKLREEALLRMKSDIRRVFDKYDRDNSGSLDVKEVSVMFADLGIEPHCRQDQDEIKRLLDEVDEDGNGEFDFDEFVVLVQRVQQQLHTLQRRREQELAMELGFSNAQVLEMREAFWELDHDHNNELTLGEARRVVVILRKSLTDDELTKVYMSIERNNNGCLEFIGFMQMMKHIESL